jgi:hypothetical protein
VARITLAFPLTCPLRRSRSSVAVPLPSGNKHCVPWLLLSTYELTYATMQYTSSVFSQLYLRESVTSCHRNSTGSSLLRVERIGCRESSLSLQILLDTETTVTRFISSVNSPLIRQISTQLEHRIELNVNATSLMVISVQP